MSALALVFALAAAEPAGIDGAGAPPAGIDAAAAERFARLALSCVHKEYPTRSRTSSRATRTSSLRAS
jgi:hypothetical protein